MEQRLNLERQLRDERDKLQVLRYDIKDLERRVSQKEMVMLGPLGTRTDMVSFLKMANDLSPTYLIGRISSIFPCPGCRQEIGQTRQKHS